MNIDYILLIHKLAYDNLENGISYQAVIDKLKSKGLDINNQSLIASIDRTFNQVFVDSNRANVGFSKDYTGNYFMLTDAYFRYLEYVELVESRKNAESAKRQARHAIYITLFALVVSIVIGILQLVA